MRKNSLIVSWGFALCASGALLATGCKSAGFNMPGGRMMSWLNKDSSIAKNDPIKPPSQLDIPGPSETEIASSQSDTGEQYPTQDRGYSDIYPGASSEAGASVASNTGFGAGSTSWSPDAAQSPTGQTEFGGTGAPTNNPYVADAANQFKGGSFNGGAEQFGPTGEQPWNDPAAGQITNNPYVNQQPGGTPGDFNGGQLAEVQSQPAAPTYPQTDYPDSYPTRPDSQFSQSQQPPVESYIAGGNQFTQPPAQPPTGGTDFGAQGDFQQPPMTGYDSQSVARADSTYGAAPQPSQGSAGDVIPPPSNLMNTNGNYAPGSTSYAGGTMVADQRGGVSRTTHYGNDTDNTNGGSFQPGGGSFDPSGTQFR